MLLDFLASLLESRITAAFLAFLLVLVGTAAWRYLVPLLRVIRQIGGARRTLDRSKSDRPAPELIRSRALASPWKQFARDWTEGGLELGGVHRGVVPPGHYFRATRVLNGRGRAIPHALPGVFAGIGILGTFVGILVGLYDIQATGTSQALMESVQGLLSGMSTAFATSIAGITLSILWLLTYRGFLGHAEAQLAQLAASIEERFPTWRDIDIVRSTLEAQRRQIEDDAKVIELQEEQKAILQNLGTDIADTMEHALTSALNQTVAPALDDLSKSFGDLAADIRGQQLEGLGEMADAFQKRLMETVTSDFDRLAETIRTAADVQERTSSDLERFFERLGMVAGKQTELLETTTQAAEQFEGAVEGLAAVHASVKEIVPGISGVSEKLSGLVQDMVAQSSVLGDANTELREALAGQLDSIQSQVQTMSGFWEEFSGHLEGFREQLETSVLEFRNVAAERLSEVFKQFDRETARVVEHLSGTLAEIREVGEDLPTNIGRLQETVASLQTPIDDVSSALEEGQTRTAAAGEAIAGHVGRLSEVTGPLASRLDQVEGSARDMLVAMNALAETLGKLQPGRQAPAPSETKVLKDPRDDEDRSDGRRSGWFRNR